MDLIEAIKSGDYSTVLLGVAEIEREQDKHFQDLLMGIEMKFEELINDTYVDSVVLKKTRTKTSKTVNANWNQVNNIDLKVPRASKAINMGHDIVNSVDSKNSRQSRPVKKKLASTESTFLIVKPDDKESVCPSELKEPLGSSTPTDNESLTQVEEVKQVDPPATAPSVNIHKTPISDWKCPVQGESVKKRIEEFEKRTQTATQSITKLPVSTPVKLNHVSKITKNLTNQMARITPVKSHIYVEQKNVILNNKITKMASKILREKNTNVKASRDGSKDRDFKKPVTKKVPSVTSIENKMKTEIAVKTTVSSKPEPPKKKQVSIKAVEQKKKKKEESVKEAKPVEFYNIDDVSDGALTDDDDNPSRDVPSWATRENRKAKLCAQAYVDKTEYVRPWFYNPQLKNPKVEELFSDKVKLRPRTSSAVWNNSNN